jgi:hypothetical protein
VVDGRLEIAAVAHDVSEEAQLVRRPDELPAEPFPAEGGLAVGLRDECLPVVVQRVGERFQEFRTALARPGGERVRCR